MLPKDKKISFYKLSDDLACRKKACITQHVGFFLSHAFFTNTSLSNSLFHLPFQRFLSQDSLSFPVSNVIDITTMCPSVVSLLKSLALLQLDHHELMLLPAYPLFQPQREGPVILDAPRRMSLTLHLHKHPFSTNDGHRML